MGRAALALLAASLGVGCTAGGSSQAWGPGTTTTSPRGPATNDEGSGFLAVPLEATEEPVATVPSTNPGTELGTEPAADPVEPRASFAGVGACQDLAAGPWAPVPHGRHPVGAVRSRQLPDYIAGDGGTPLDEITEFPTIDAYRDPSTLGDPTAVYDAFQAAGYVTGIEARYEEGNHLTVVTVVQFRDAEGARAALSAHLDDYCSRAIEGYALTESNGLVVLRESQSARSIFVLDDVEVPVLVCSCYGENGTERQYGVEGWSGDISARLQEPAPDAPPV